VVLPRSVPKSLALEQPWSCTLMANVPPGQPHCLIDNWASTGIQQNLCLLLPQATPGAPSTPSARAPLLSWSWILRAPVTLTVSRAGGVGQ
jgi:hypothetical protein